MKILDKLFESYISQHQLQQAAERLAKEIDEHYAHQDLLILPVLNGAFMFAADVIRRITIPCRVSFVKVASYEGMHSTGTIQEVIGIIENLRDKHVLIIEDIVDTGETVYHLLKQLNAMAPKSTKIATCLFKKSALKRDLILDFVGFEIENVFVVGYGLDYNGYGRNLPEVYKLKAD